MLQVVSETPDQAAGHTSRRLLLHPHYPEPVCNWTLQAWATEMFVSLFPTDFKLPFANRVDQFPQLKVFCISKALGKVELLIEFRLKPSRYIMFLSDKPHLIWPQRKTEPLVSEHV